MPRKQKKYHYIYKTTNILNDKFYIGMHSTDNLDDGYVGSGKRLWYSINKHGKENHICEILEHLPDRKALKSREAEIVNKNLLNDKLCMNLAIGGGYGWDYLNQNSELQKQKAIKSNIRQAWLRENDKEWVERKSQKISHALKMAYNEGRKTHNAPDWTGKTHTMETKQKMSDAKKGNCSLGDNANAKRVIDDNGVLFTSYKECALHNNISPETVTRRVKNGRYKTDST